MSEDIKNLISAKELYKEYDWFQNTFSPLLQEAGEDFFTKLFDIKFIALSKNFNCLQNNEPCFVTKVKVDKEYDLFLRLNDKAVQIILDRILGKGKNKFDINHISELEAKIITSFNSHVYDNLKSTLVGANPKELRRSNFDIVHLTFLLKDLDESVTKTGKIFVSLPAALLAPEEIQVSSQKFSKEDFSITEVSGKFIVGTMKSSLYDAQHLEIDDVVVLENSNIAKLKMCIQGKEMDVNINPNMDLLIEDDDEEAEENDNMPKTQNLWDSIEVEMNAEFDAVKITLGELRNIENGMVVDLTSLYDNNVLLKVENKPIASGTLVIINDRYGVKINKIFEGENAGNNPKPRPQQNNDEIENQDDIEENIEESIDENINESMDEEIPQDDMGGNEEDFDYSDFELEDENI